MVVSKTNPYDIFSPEAQRNPFLYEQMRNEAPVHAAIHPQTGQTFWFLTRYDDCLNFLRDTRFGKESPYAVPVRSLSNEVVDNRRAVANQHMLNLDDPAHARLKSLVHIAFTPLRINNLRVRLQVIADSLFDAIDGDIADGDEFDLTQSYISQLPFLSIAAMLGIPPADYDNLYNWTHNMLSPDVETVHDAIAEFSSYLHEQINLRQKNPAGADDLLSALIIAEDAGDRLSRQELLAMVFLLITAGYETMVNFISNGIMALFENPGQMQLLQEHINDASVLKTAIEEMLRYSGPSHMTLASWAFEDVEIRNQVIHQGDSVHAVLFAANRDPLVFENPHQFNILRQPNKHIAFSYGIHHCLGAALARLEGEIAITTLLRRMPNL
jgi:cytochrome P450